METYRGERKRENICGHSHLCHIRLITPFSRRLSQQVCCPIAWRETRLPLRVLQHIHNIIVEEGCGLHCSASRGQHASLKLHPRSIQTTRQADGHKGCIVLINSPAHCAEHRERRISIQSL